LTYLLAIDQGTHASRAALFDTHGTRHALAEAPVSIDHRGVEVEQDAREILDRTREVIDQVLQRAPGTVTAAGLAVQRSTLVVWDDASGAPLAPALNWQDTRAAPLIRPLAPRAEAIQAITGLPLSAHYLAGKIRWLVEHAPKVAEAAKAGRLRCGPLASFLAFHLLQERPCRIDHSNAGRSLLFDLDRRDWSPELLEAFAIPSHWLPTPVPTQAKHGHLAGTDIPLTCLCGDQNAAIHARGPLREDEALINLGTGAFVLRSTGARRLRHAALLGGIARSTEDDTDYVLEGTVNGAGSALDWLAERQGPIAWDTLDRDLAAVKDPPLFLNTVGGLGSPHWRSGLTPGFEPDRGGPMERTLAVLESILFLIMDNLQAMDASSLRRLILSGGLSRLDRLCQGLADLSGLPVERRADPETTLRGAAWLANQPQRPWPATAPAEPFLPNDDAALRRRYDAFRALLEARLQEAETREEGHA
jgi:glycerol kinase